MDMYKNIVYMPMTIIVKLQHHCVCLQLQYNIKKGEGHCWLRIYELSIVLHKQVLH
jgi:hypothetical protein